MHRKQKVSGKTAVNKTRPQNDTEREGNLHLEHLKADRRDWADADLCATDTSVRLRNKSIQEDIQCMKTELWHKQTPRWVEALTSLLVLSLCLLQQHGQLSLPLLRRKGHGCHFFLVSSFRALTALSGEKENHNPPFSKDNLPSISIKNNIWCKYTLKRWHF